MATPTGILYIIATPIGNIKDITLRALEHLESVDGIIAEDTRETGKLLKLLKIDPRPPFHSYHAQSKPGTRERLIEKLQKGENLAYVSDAGTPGISDPGTYLAQAAWEAGISVVPIPGPSALTAALSAAGIPSREFLFLGFLPKKKGRQTMFKNISEAPHTVVFYESTHRILKALASLSEVLGDREITLAKELTKMHERYFFGTAAAIAKEISAEPGTQKGEWVVIVPSTK